jgi:hypothetical protein
LSVDVRIVNRKGELLDNERSLYFSAMMNSYNDFVMQGNPPPPMQPDYSHQFANNSPIDMPYSNDPFVSQQPIGNRHMNMMSQGSPAVSHHHPQPNMHQVFSSKTLNRELVRISRSSLSSSIDRIR